MKNDLNHDSIRQSYESIRCKQKVWILRNTSLNRFTIYFVKYDLIHTNKKLLFQPKFLLKFLF